MSTGDIYTNSELRTNRKKIYKFSALSINQGLAIAVTITVLTDNVKPKTTITTTTTTTIATRLTTEPDVSKIPNIKQSFRIENNLLINTNTTSDQTVTPTEPTTTMNVIIQSDKPSYQLTQNVKILIVLLVACLTILLGVLYTTFFIIRRNQAQSNGKIMVNSRTRSSRSGDQLNYICTSSTNLTPKQEMDSRSYLSKFITWFKPVDIEQCSSSSQKTSTSASLVDSLRSSKKSSSHLHHDNLIIRPHATQTLFTYSDGYLNDMGINMLDGLVRNGKQATNSHAICDSNRSSNLIEPCCRDVPVVLNVASKSNVQIDCFGQKVEYLDVDFGKWAHMLDWRPEYNSIAHVLDELVQLESNGKQ